MVSDEAFVLTVIENYFERWKKEGLLRATGKEIVVKQLPKPKWTDVGSCGSTGNTCSSWSDEGLRKLNQYMVDINSMRQLSESRKLEELYKNHINNTTAKKSAAGYKRKVDEVVVYDEFSDDESDIASDEETESLSSDMET